MNKMKQALKRVYESPCFPFLVLFLLMLVIHAGMYTDFNDDIVNRAKVLEKGVLGYALQLYKEWSSRILIEISYLFLLVRSAWVWRVLDSAVIVLLAYSITKLFAPKGDRLYSWYAVGIVLLYPWMHMMTAGWIGTTANYSWSLALGLYALTPLRGILAGEKIPWYRLVLPLLATVYAADEEQMTALLIGFLVLAIVYMAVVQKRTHVYPILQMLIAIGWLIFIFTSPGNENRMQVEIGSHYPDFLMHSPFERLYNLVMLTGNNFISMPNLTFTVICMLAAICVWTRYHEPLYRTIAGIPLAGSLFLGAFSPVFSAFFPSFSRIPDMSAHTVNFYQKSLYIPFILYIIIGGCLLLSLHLAFRGQQHAWLSVILICAGMASRFIMAFSPTMYASGSRTEIFLYFSMLIVSFLLICRLYKERPRCGMRFIGSGIAILAACSYINFWLSI